MAENQLGIVLGISQLGFSDVKHCSRTIGGIVVE
jgi:hypothetical protein